MKIINNAAYLYSAENKNQHNIQADNRLEDESKSEKDK